MDVCRRCTSAALSAFSVSSPHSPGSRCARGKARDTSQHGSCKRNPQWRMPCCRAFRSVMRTSSGDTSTRAVASSTGCSKSRSSSLPGAFTLTTTSLTAAHGTRTSALGLRGRGCARAAARRTVDVESGARGGAERDAQTQLRRIFFPRVREGHLHQRPRSARAADCGAGPRKSCRYGQLAAPLPPPLATRA